MKLQAVIAALFCVILCGSCATAASVQFQSTDLPPSCRPDYDHCVDSCSGREAAMESANVAVGCLVWILTLGVCAPRPVLAEAEANRCVNDCNWQARTCMNAPAGSPAPAPPPEATSSQAQSL